MTKVTELSLDTRGDNAMSAYYYSFERTGVEMIDRILAEVAHAGKAHHDTDRWDEHVLGHKDDDITVVDRIQAAANLATDDVEHLCRMLTLPLIFHAGGRVSPEAHAEWKRLTGSDEMTTKVMCDAIRAVLK